MTCDVIEVTTLVGSGKKGALWEQGGRKDGSSRRRDKEEEEQDEEGRPATLTSPQGSGEKAKQTGHRLWQ